MKKLLLFFVLIPMILLSSCKWSINTNKWSKDSRTISKIEKNYEKYNGYKCQANIRTTTGRKEYVYLIEESYEKPNKYKLEILEPKKSKGIIILNINDEVSVDHPSIDESISLITINSLNNQMLIGDFYEKINKAKLINKEEIEGEEYLVFEIKLDEKNKHRNSARVWLRQKGYTPYKLSVLDNSGALKVEIIYNKFKFIRRLKR